VHRTQITLTDDQYARLRDESARSGHSLAELIRRALDERYESVSQSERLQLLDSAFGGWAHRDEDGAAFVERVRSGSARRLRSSG
jgi:Ribbon-helix-helix protein, copG family